MKIATLFSAALLTLSAFAVHAADKQAVGKAPVLMTDAEMKEVVGGTPAGGAGFGICTAVLKAGAPGAIATWTLNPLGTHQVGMQNGNGNQPGFGQLTAKGTSLDGCFVGG